MFGRKMNLYLDVVQDRAKKYCWGCFSLASLFPQGCEVAAHSSETKEAIPEYKPLSNFPEELG